MQLDIFAHSRDVMLRNDVAAALRQRDLAATDAALAKLSGEYADDPWLPPLRLLAGTLTPWPRPASAAAASAALRLCDAGVIPAARQVFGGSADAWLAPLWRSAAAAHAALPFAESDAAAHAAALLLRAGDWAPAAAAIAAIASWRRQPTPLAWMTQATARSRGADAAWPLLAELAWLAPARIPDLVARLAAPQLSGLLARFDREFAGDDSDYDWFPAWAAIADAGLAAGLRLAEVQNDSPAEHAARLVVRALSHERRGEQAPLLDARRQFKAIHPSLFACYMRTR